LALKSVRLGEDKLLRFVFISTMSDYPWGGSEELWSRAALRLREKGHEVFVSVVWWPELSPQIVNLKVRGIVVFVRRRALSSLPRRFWRKIQPWIGQRHAEFKWLCRTKPDLVIISQGGNTAGLEWMWFCLQTGLPFVTIVQCNTEILWPRDDAVERMAKAYQTAKRVFCVSRHNLELLEHQIGESLPNARIVWNPCNVSTEARAEWPKENGLCKLACVARLEPAAKGQDLLFETFSRPQWKTRSVQINLYGAGPWENNLRRLAEKLRLKNVHFRGQVSDVKTIWEENHLLVLPSRYEGLPLALVEAMWCGRPAVVTDVGGNAELCLDNETGFVAAAPALRFVEEASERAWNRRADWQRMGLAARARAEQLIPIDPIGDFCREMLKCLSFP
jgi:glycosyltransferase involved in cell wall biosynthesis